ncbi:MAG TPA: DUF6689 family protein [Thermoanaerobaculia bacterium]|jgi:hypothetical protein|nr:DUF6689 family protein [Thermoanaerobaculia bacterium]
MTHRRLVCAALAAAALLIVLLPGAASAQLPPTGPTVTIDGNKASVTLAAGGVSIDVTLTFEQVVGLNAANLGISARVVSPSELVGRMPDASLTSLPAGFPLMVTVEPPASGGLSFSGVAAVDVHTHDLSFTADSPLRLFKAPIGGQFADITETMGMGSYRARGSSGGFSQFLIVADLRSDSDVVERKLDALDAAFAKGAGAIPPSVRNVLQSSLGAIRTAWNGGDVRGAISAAEAFATGVKAAADAGSVPNVWRSARDLDNVAGNLRSAAGTLRFSLSMAE